MLPADSWTVFVNELPLRYGLMNLTGEEFNSREHRVAEGSQPARLPSPKQRLLNNLCTAANEAAREQGRLLRRVRGRDESIAPPATSGDENGLPN
jgi:hypothetical protein